jgi:hypothetical protein
MSTTEPDDVAQLRTELESLKHQLASEKKARSARVRSIASWVLVVLAVFATILALLSIWTFRTLNDTDLFVDRVGSIIEQPEVAQAIGDTAAAELVDAIDLQDRIADVLPEQAALVAAPITTAAQEYLAEAATSLIGTEQFQAAWDAALAEGHRLSIGVLSGNDTEVIENSDGLIVLNITPIINAILAEGAVFLSDLLNRDISAPTVTPETIDEAVSVLEEQLGTELPADFGTIVLFESENLAAAQRLYSAVSALIWLGPIAALVLIGLAIAVSTRRVRTLAAIVVGVALGLLLVRLALAPAEESLAAAVSDAGLAAAVGAAFSTITASLVDGIALILILGILAAAVLFMTGDSAMAQKGRGALQEAPGLAARYRGAFLIGGAVLALLLLTAIPGRSWGQFLIVLLIYAAFALAVLLAPRSDAADAEPPAVGA